MIISKRNPIAGIEGARKREAMRLRIRASEVAAKERVAAGKEARQEMTDSSGQAGSECSEQEGELGEDRSGEQGGSCDSGLTANARSEIRTEAIVGGRAKLWLLKNNEGIQGLN